MSGVFPACITSLPGIDTNFSGVRGWHRAGITYARLNHSSSSLGPRASRPHRAPSGALIATPSPANVPLALRARCGRDARGPSEELETLTQR